MAYYNASNQQYEVLAHQGVKGMRWGVRKAVASVGRRASNHKQKKELDKKNAKIRNDASKYFKSMSANPRKYSKDELDAAANRLRSENNYKTEYMRSKQLAAVGKKDYGKMIMKYAPIVLSNPQVQAMGKAAFQAFLRKYSHGAYPGKLVN